MRSIKPILDTCREFADGTYPVRISVYIKGVVRYYINTGITITKDQWNGVNIIKHPQKDVYNNLLRFRTNRLDSELIAMETSGELYIIAVDDLKKRLTEVVSVAPQEKPKEEEKGLTVKVAFERMIATKDKERTIDIYRSTLSKIDFLFEGADIDMASISLKWLREFELKMKDQGLSINSIALHMRNLRAVLNLAIDDELITNYPFRKYKVKSEETTKRSLSVDELRVLRDYPCQAHQEKYRDMFMLMVYLVGINAVDLFNCRGLTGDRVEYRRSKTGSLYSIKVEPEAMAIIEKYRGEEYLLNVCDGYSNYHDFLRRMNENLRSIGELEWVANKSENPLYVKKNKKKITALFPQLTSYWLRHTSATIASGLDIPIETISAAMGHKLGSSVTAIYIKYDKRKIDNANRSVIDYINGSSDKEKEQL